MKVTMKVFIRTSSNFYSGRDPIMARDVDLPFLPLPGLGVDGDEISEVNYDTTSGKLTAYLKDDDRECQKQGFLSDEDTDRVISEWQERGWTLEQP